jgi:Flp pilus assembly protein TadG
MRRFFRNEEGATFITFAITASVLIVIVLAAISLTTNTAKQSQFTQTVDSALLAAISGSSAAEDDAVRTQFARQFFQSNMPDSGNFKLNSINVTKVDKYEWKIEAEATADTGSLGSSTLSHSAKVRWEGTTASEIVLVGSVAGSMCTTDRSNSGDDIYKFQKVSNCTNPNVASKFNAMKKGFTTVLDKGVEVVNLPNSFTDLKFAYRVGVVPFNHKVKLPAATETKKLPNARRAGFQPDVPIEEQYTAAQLTETFMYNDGWASIGSSNNLGLPQTRTLPAPLLSTRDNAAFYNNFNDVAPLPMVYPLVDIASPQSKKHLHDYLNLFYQDYQGMGWNRTNVGLLTAGLMLDPRFNASFGGVRPAEFKDPQIEKIVILMTDGANIGCCFATFPEETFEHQYLREYAVDSAHMIGIDEWKSLGGNWDNSWKATYGVPDKGVCETLKENDVKVYTIGFGIPKSDNVRGNAREVLEACSSGPQYFFDLDETDAQGLEDAYRTIAQSLVKLRLIE